MTDTAFDIPDLSRVDEHLNRDLLCAATVAFIGVGGAVTIGAHFARCGVSKFIAIDPDTVSATNIATQGYFPDQIGKLKTAAFAENIGRINPAAAIRAIGAAYEDLRTCEHNELWREADLVLAMTDQHAVQVAINRDALAAGKSTIFAMMGDGLQQMEVTATIPGAVAAGNGCFECQVWPRVIAYREGFKNRRVIGSHIVSAEMLNSQIAYLALGLLHHLVGSPRPIAKLGARFAARPCLITQLDPDLWRSDPDSYGIVPPGMELFTTKLFPLDSPKGWICEACGTAGVA
jgi:hypothetical protein